MAFQCDKCDGVFSGDPFDSTSEPLCFKCGLRAAMVRYDDAFRRLEKHLLGEDDDESGNDSREE